MSTITIYQGVPWERTATTPFACDGVQSQIRRAPVDTSRPEESWPELLADITVGAPTGNSWPLSLTGDQAAALPAGTHVLDFLLDETGGGLRRSAPIYVTVERAVTVAA